MNVSQASVIEEVSVDQISQQLVRYLEVQPSDQDLIGGNIVYIHNNHLNLAESSEADKIYLIVGEGVQEESDLTEALSGTQNVMIVESGEEPAVEGNLALVQDPASISESSPEVEGVVRGDPDSCRSSEPSQEEMPGNSDVSNNEVILSKNTDAGTEEESTESIEKCAASCSNALKDLFTPEDSIAVEKALSETAKTLESIEEMLQKECTSSDKMEKEAESTSMNEDEDMFSNESSRDSDDFIPGSLIQRCDPTDDDKESPTSPKTIPEVDSTTSETPSGRSARIRAPPKRLGFSPEQTKTKTKKASISQASDSSSHPADSAKMAADSAEDKPGKSKKQSNSSSADGSTPKKRRKKEGDESSVPKRRKKPDMFILALKQKTSFPLLSEKKMKAKSLKTLLKMQKGVSLGLKRTPTIHVDFLAEGRKSGELSSALREKRCDIRIRCQSSTPTSSSNYSCSRCGFQTSRMDNMVRHKKNACPFSKDFFSWDQDTFQTVTNDSISVATSKDVFELGDEEIDDDELFPTSFQSKRDPKQRLFYGPPKKIGVTVSAVEEESKEMNKPTESLKASTSKNRDVSLDDSDGEDLPSLSSIIGKNDFSFSEDDVVWVEFKRLHWPGLIMKSYPKSKKAYVFFIGSAPLKQGVRVGSKKLFSFSDADRNKQFLDEGRRGPYSASLVKAVQQAEEFLRKRILGISLNPRQFFFNADVGPNESSTEKGQEPQDEDEEMADAAEEVPASPRSSSPVPSDKDSEISGTGSESEIVLKRRERRRQQNEKLIKCITDSKTDSHLLGVLNKSIPSVRNKMFNSERISVRNKLKHMNWFGPVDDDEQQETVINHCTTLLKANKPHKNFEEVAYVFEVWCPEAIIKALSRIRRVTLSQAEKIFYKGAHWSKEEFREASKLFDSGPLTQEEKEQTIKRMRDCGLEESILASIDI